VPLQWKLVQAVCLTGGVCMQGFVGSAIASIDSVDAACDQVGNSRRLQDVLRAVLAVGNALNTGTARASADGVKLDSLMKLADVKVLSLSPLLWYTAVSDLCTPPSSGQMHLSRSCMQLFDCPVPARLLG